MLNGIIDEWLDEVKRQELTTEERDQERKKGIRKSKTESVGVGMGVG